MSEVAVVVRNASVSTVAFLAALLAGRRAGKKNAEIATGLGMNVNSFNVRVTTLRKRCEKDAAAKRAKGETVVNPFDEIDKLKSTRSASNVFDNAELTAKLAEVDGETGESPESAAPETPAVAPEVTA